VETHDRVELSVVLPCFNEAGSLPALTAELLDVLGKVGLPFEVLYVDDTSTDASPAILAGLQRQHPEIRVIRHARNCGESAAQATGFRHARGELLITMDSDGQNDPSDIPRLLAALRTADCVCGVRTTRRDDWVKRLSSAIGNGVRRLITGDRVTDAGCTYRALRRAALAELPVFNGMHRFLPTLLRIQGWSVVEIPVGHRPRTAGVSKYGIGNRMLRGLTDCVAIRWYRRRAVPTARSLPERAE
jgi:glycosyltransferase involved in cell wall biosynthesis